jgi:uncharacterized protein (DUF3084 family)
VSNEKAAPIPQERIDELIAQMSNSDDFCFEGDFQDCAKALNQQDQHIATLTAEVAALKAEIARLSAPVTPRENTIIDFEAEMAYLDEIDARATPPDQKGD